MQKGQNNYNQKGMHAVYMYTCTIIMKGTKYLLAIAKNPQWVYHRLLALLSQLQC